MTYLRDHNKHDLLTKLGHYGDQSSIYITTLHHVVQEGQSDLTLFTTTPPAENCVKCED